MSLDVFKIAQEWHIAAKAEATTGTAIALSATEAQMIVYDAVMNGDYTEIKRKLGGSMNANVSVAGTPTGTCTFSVELAGSGTTAAPYWATTFLPACGMAFDGTNTFTFAGSSATAGTVTIGLYEDGMLRTLAGASGNAVFDLTAGTTGMVHFTFQGRYNAEADVALPSPTLPTIIGPTVAGSACVFGSYAPIYSKVTLDLGNQLVYRLNGASPGGLRAAAIAGERETVVTIDPEQDSVANMDWDGLRSTSTVQAFSITNGPTGSHNQVILSSGNAQVIAAPRGNRNNIVTRDVKLKLSGATPLTLTFAA